MKQISAVREMQEVADLLRREGRTIGVVPTMGYLHEGHLSLIAEAKRNAYVTVTTIFVNPTQFAPGEDYQRYPRDFNRDKQLIESAGSEYLFAPSVEEMYPSGFSTYVEVGKITGILEGKFRPAHFRGVTTIVLKLFNTIKPHIAVFGQKDAQQVIVIRRMVRDLNQNIHIIVAPTVREKDGLAMSSRNIYLSPEQRKECTAIYKSLKHGEQMIAGGEGNCARIIAEISSILTSQPSLRIDYVSVVDADTLDEYSVINKNSRVLISLAVRVGTTRLIDNIIVNI
jgi:pantoate--beta-alanine ligase